MPCKLALFENVSHAFTVLNKDSGESFRASYYNNTLWVSYSLIHHARIISICYRRVTTAVSSAPKMFLFNPYNKNNTSIVRVLCGNGGKKTGRNKPAWLTWRHVFVWRIRRHIRRRIEFRQVTQFSRSQNRVSVVPPVIGNQFRRPTGTTWRRRYFDR